MFFGSPVQWKPCKSNRLFSLKGRLSDSILPAGLRKLANTQRVPDTSLVLALAIRSADAGVWRELKGPPFRLISPLAQVLVRKLNALPLLGPSSGINALLPLARVLVRRELQATAKVLCVPVRTSQVIRGGVVRLTSRVDRIS